MHVPRVRILAFDTSSDAASVALVDDGTILAELAARVSARHGETLLPRIEEVLALAHASRASIDLVAVGLGPGSFTGVRIGVATAKGLALGLDRPIVGVRTSEVLAASASGARRVVLIDAKKAEVFASAWSADGDTLTVALEDVHGSPEVIAARVRDVLGGGAVTLIGTALAAYPSLALAFGGDAAIVEDPHPRAAVLARLARAAFASRGPDDRARLEPVYVRAADALLPAARA